MRKALGAVLALGVGAVLVWKYGLQESHRLPGQPPVVVITIDTLRADYVDQAELPALQAFLKTARRFRGARTVAPITVPAHTSLFSGVYPGRHGVSDNATGTLPRARGFPLLAEEFRDAGYATAAFVACSVLGKHTGLDAGFLT